MDLDIRGFIETSLLDWDGKVVSTLYVPRCNFRCPFCHNFGLVNLPDQYDPVPFEKIKKYLISHKDFIDGICLTGGEPCLHKDRGLFEFLRAIKELDFLVKVDTNGTDPRALEEMINKKLVDYIAMDIKAPLDERYDKLSGVKTDLNMIKLSIKVIIESGLHYEFRTTVVPGLLSENDIEDIAKGIKDAERFVLQQFDPKNTWDINLRKVNPYSKEKLEGMMEAARPYVKNVSLRGVKDVK